MALTRRTRSNNTGFTLIELLVVVAIMAMLIGILLPSLSKARAQARTTVCASRLAELTKAMLLYAEDYDDTPPFVGIGYEDLDKSKTWYSHDSMTYWAENENWLMPKMRLVWLSPESEWDTLSGGQAKVQKGTLFRYARFEAVYKCPDFERVGNKEQSVFNYTRSVMGRKVLSAAAEDREAGDAELYPGQILKTSQVHSPAAMYMMLDEQWDFHCAGNYNDGGDFDLGGYWMGADSIHGIIGDMIGSYHGTLGKVIQSDAIRPSMKGNVGHYDGHVELVQDPVPWRDFGGGDLFALSEGLIKVGNYLLQQIFAQRGINLTLADLAGILK